MQTFEQVYKDNYSKLYTLAFRMTGKKEDAEDVLQNAFINAFKAYDYFRQESSAYTWLYKIVLNESKKYMMQMAKMPVDHYAEENNKTAAEIFQYVNSFGEVEDEVLVNNSKETCLQLFMNCMPWRYRVVFTLRVILQFSDKETAEMLDMSESSVKTNLHRARKMIKESMEGKCSLINENAPCKCSTWVKYAIETNRKHIIKDIAVIKNNEKRIADRFNREVKELVKITELYNTRIVPPSYDMFRRSIEKIMKEGSMQILRAES